MNLVQARNVLRSHADPQRAALSLRFFKTGKGEYGEGDRFLGVIVPQIRAVAHRCLMIGLPDVAKVLKSPWHEERLLALIILTLQYPKADQRQKQKIFEFYLKHTKWINNWDLVDTSAHKIVGAHLAGKDDRLLDRLAVSKNMWERRIAMIATADAINRGDSGPAIRIATKLLKDKHDLMHKAVGWMLREVGKRCSRTELEAFLARHKDDMPRTALRYAIEHFPEAKRRAYLAKS
jgi:3-methyladenine DNA glycosylase AlkD